MKVKQVRKVTGLDTANRIALIALIALITPCSEAINPAVHRFSLLNKVR